MPINFKDVELEYHDSWRNFLSQQVLQCLNHIQTNIGDNFTPPAGKVLRFMSFNLSKTQVVILGQDPYPQPSVATGRAFEVGELNCWIDLKRNTSLQNILKLIHKNYKRLHNIAKIEDVRSDISDCSFPILPPNELFENWEKQGVLLLNTSLTCELNKPNSHKNLWACFMQRVVNYISQKSPNAIWLLWGQNAQEFGLGIPQGKKFESKHPRLNSQKNGSFLHENHFDKKLQILWHGKSV